MAKTKPKLKAKPLFRNDWPSPADWPIKKGTKVWGVATELVVGNPRIICGKVKHYNPATKDSYLVTKGKPFYNIDGLLIDANLVFPYTPKGQADALFILADMQRRTANNLQASASYYLKLADGAVDLAGRILQSHLRSLKRKRKK